MTTTTTTAEPDSKIIDLIHKYKAEQQQNGDKKKPIVALEFFPPRTAEGVKNLHARMERMKAALNPLYTDITWGAGGSTADLSMDLALHMKQQGHVANLHMTCTNIDKNQDADPKQAIQSALQTAWNGGIRNIVALRGDPPAGQETWTATEGGFTCALDLIQFIRQQQHFAEEFGIAVAGYPEGHPNAISEITSNMTLTDAEKARSAEFDGKTYCCLDADYQKELDYLKQKVDAGGDLIITQMFFDTTIFLQFVKDCRKLGITCPIVPGLMCINNYNGFVKMTKFCKTRVPTELRETMESLKDAPADSVKQFGIEFGVKMCQTLIDSGEVDILHFYTLNLEKVVYGILEGLGNGGWWTNLTEKANEADAASMVAKGSAWARVGDAVTVNSCGGNDDDKKKNGVVVELDQATGKAVIRLDGTEEMITLEKGQYQKAF